MLPGKMLLASNYLTLTFIIIETFNQTNLDKATLQKRLKVIDHEITLKILEFTFNSKEKVEPVSLLSSMCMFLELNGTKS